ncbi:MAG: hypothetical protein JXL84_13515 [Deltaproteobacteria bacterium]|nr:hypothetical protein [Deltaproteobacteria bacterium]
MCGDRIREERFSATYYLQSIRAMVMAPGDFLEGVREPSGIMRSLGFLLVSSLIHAVFSLSLLPPRPLLTAFILFLNALAMPLIAAAIGWVLMAAMRRRSPLSKVFAVYAFSSGTTHLVSWIPLAVWITEPWRWILVGIGIVRGCGLSRLQAGVVIIVSILAIMLLFSLLSPLLVGLKA